MQYKNGMLFHDRYLLERLIGRGSFSEVWLSTDTKTDIQVAIKIFAPATGLDEDGLSLFAREFSLVVNLNDGHILKPLHFDTCERNPYLVLPFFPNGSVQKRVGLFKEDEIWKLIHDVACGLKYLHSSTPAIIHQDIKPDNIMIAEDGQYVLSDFGISSHCRSVLRKSVSESFSSAGTTAYMGPERFGKQSGTSIMASDIYSLGVTAYELMTGNTPFGDDGGLIQKKGADIPDMAVPCSSQLKKVISMCLMPEPWDRPTAAKLVEYSEKAIKGETIIFDSAKKKLKVLVPIIAALVVAICFGLWRISENRKLKQEQEKARMEYIRIQDSIRTELDMLIGKVDRMIDVATSRNSGYDSLLLESRDICFQVNNSLPMIDDSSALTFKNLIDNKLALIDTCLVETLNSLNMKIQVFADDEEAVREFTSRSEKIRKALNMKSDEENTDSITLFHF